LHIQIVRFSHFIPSLSVFKFPLLASYLCPARTFIQGKRKSSQIALSIQLQALCHSSTSSAFKGFLLSAFPCVLLAVVHLVVAPGGMLWLSAPRYAGAVARALQVHLSATGSPQVAECNATKP
jgi:hypothetical protein